MAAPFRCRCYHAQAGIRLVACRSGEHHLARYLDHFLEAAIEVPLSAWREMGGSKLRITHIVKVPFELLKIRSHYGSHLPSR